MQFSGRELVCHIQGSKFHPQYHKKKYRWTDLLWINQIYNNSSKKKWSLYTYQLVFQRLQIYIAEIVLFFLLKRSNIIKTNSIPGKNGFFKKSNSIWNFSPRQSPSPETTVLSVSSMSESDSKWSYPPQRKTQLSAQHLNIIPATLCTVRDA